MDPRRRSRLGASGVEVTAIGLGGTGLGNIYTAVEEQEALATVAAAHDAGIRYFDTAPAYGSGLSELRLGRALADLPRDQLVIGTKVGYDLVPQDPGEQSTLGFADGLPFRAVTDFSRAAVERSLEQSLERLGVDRIDVVYIHDPDEGVSMDRGRDPYERSHFEQAMAEAYPLLDRLRAEGTIGAIGVGMNGWRMLEDFARAGEFDCFLLANRYTLLEQEALATFLPLCVERGVSVIAGGPFNSGILATGAVAGARYDYQPAGPEILARVRRLETVAAAHAVPLAAAALQFPLGHPAVVSVIPGARSPAELDQNCALVAHPIPAAFWAELRDRSLIDPAAPLPTEDR